MREAGWSPEEGQPALPTHYEVLGISEALLDEQTDPSAIIKRAYHRALLRNHPDKAVWGTSYPVPSVSHSNAPSATPPVSIDQISTAFKVLSSPSLRAAYDQSLSLSHSRQSPNQGNGVRDGTFQTGIENVDLDDLDFDETTGIWYRGCRCGNPRGFAFGEADLEHVADQGQLIIGCLDCSLWLRVHFAFIDDDNGGEHDPRKDLASESRSDANERQNA